MVLLWFSNRRDSFPLVFKGFLTVGVVFFWFLQRFLNVGMVFLLCSKDF